MSKEKQEEIIEEKKQDDQELETIVKEREELGEQAQNQINHNSNEDKEETKGQSKLKMLGIVGSFALIGYGMWNCYKTIKAKTSTNRLKRPQFRENGKRNWK